ncbi:MAG: ATP-binding cassette domain-containing protein, partial [Clostridia bacterium]|nr:ATP-binding cassette domain-containing protein [Clostridia bacterium]
METYKNILEIKNLCVEADGKELLHDLSLTIPVGEVHALLGLNGSGKTSLMMTIMGFPRYQVTKGQILFKGKEITNLNITERARLGIGIAQQRPPTINGVKLRHILDYAVMNEPRYIHEMPAMIKTAGMEKFLDRDINNGLSGGEIKRAELLQLLATQPGFSMMDEPDSGTDLESIEIIGKLLNLLFSRDACHPAKRRAGLIVTHNGNIFDYVHV